jgi:probable HAF family extracellular repeat protein
MICFSAETATLVIPRCTLNFSFRHLLTALFSLLLVLTTSSVQAATWTSIDVPGGHDTAAAGINLAGDIVGIYLDSADAVHGFLLRAGTYTTIDVPGAISTNPYAINNTGQIAGYFGGTDGNTHGYFFDGQNFTTLDYPGARTTSAFGINNAAEVVGYYIDTNNHPHGFRWSNGNFVTVDVPGSQSTGASGINDGGLLVGNYMDANSNFLSFGQTSNGDFRTLGMPHSALVNGAVNNHNTVVGLQALKGMRYNIPRHNFLNLAYPGSGYTICNGINDSGAIVGFYYVAATGATHGFMWTD